ncbi:hypothetical protein ABPG72_015145 [Tetrahymena utriculariae]
MFLKDIFSFKRAPIDDQEKSKRILQSSNYSENGRYMNSFGSSAPSSQVSTPMSNNFNKKSINLILEQEDLDSSLKIYTKREWIQVTKTKNKESTSYNEIKANLRRGIPKSIRPRIWFWLADVKKNQQQYERGIYQRLSSYANPDWDNEIRKDVNRTVVEQEFFQGEESLGQKQLYKVLNAFSNIDVYGTGYAQGMNVIAATILLTLHDKKNFINPKKSFGKEQVTNEDIEEWAFWILFYIMQEKNHHKIYQKTMVMRKQLLKSLENKIKSECPRVLEALNYHSIDFGLAFDQDFFSIMSYKCPLPLSQFVMGMFLLDGHRALIDIISRIMLINEEELLECRELDDMLMFLKQKKNEDSWKKSRKCTYILVPFEYLQYENGRQE